MSILIRDATGQRSVNKNKKTHVRDQRQRRRAWNRGSPASHGAPQREQPHHLHANLIRERDLYRLAAISGGHPQRPRLQAPSCCRAATTSISDWVGVSDHLPATAPDLIQESAAPSVHTPRDDPASHGSCHAASGYLYPSNERCSPVEEYALMRNQILRVLPSTRSCDFSHKPCCAFCNSYVFTPDLGSVDYTEPG